MRHEFVSYAKFNLYLAVLSKRSDGYHEVDTVLQSISLADTLSFEPLDDDHLEVECDGDNIPSGPANLVWRALALLRERCGLCKGMRVKLHKRIPARAGLGGGSSNAACALAAGNLLWKLGLREGELEQMGAELGSDVPFFIRGGTQRCTGRGEWLEAVMPLADSTWVVVKPEWDLSTGAVYECIRSVLTPNEAKARMFLGFLAKRDLHSIVEKGFSDLEGPAGELQPRAAELKAWMSEAGLVGIRLAGSGSAWVGYCPDPGMARHIVSAGRERGWVVHHVRPTGRGWSEGR
ncbi:MAG: 4-(cytidine 5'-diphospho)-2-C-methyl-D-erythritol kinase [Candidatus Eisenbacteria sp.]|nr:4-(cytidine 5'-diphospho)-2-C-methyl-D-erythritol kinase [Candidatus Eisenbacteria bacterium]